MLSLKAGWGGLQCICESLVTGTETEWTFSSIADDITQRTARTPACNLLTIIFAINVLQDRGLIVLIFTGDLGLNDHMWEPSCPPSIETTRERDHPKGSLLTLYEAVYATVIYNKLCVRHLEKE